MGTPPSYAAPNPPTRQETTDLANNPAALRERIIALEERQAAILKVLHALVDQTDPDDRIGIALSMAGLA
jgi:hypothetical protein